VPLRDVMVGVWCAVSAIRVIGLIPSPQTGNDMWHTF
jgi:hypothetical protein